MSMLQHGTGEREREAGGGGMSYELLQGDCLSVLRTMDAGIVDVGVTSPPYNLGGDFHTWSQGARVSYGSYEDFGDNMPEPEYQNNQIAVLNELHRIIKSSGWLFYNHKNRIRDGRIISPLEWINKTPWIVYQDVVIDMRGTANTDKRRFFPSHEFVFVLSAGEGNKLNNTNCLTDVWRFPQVNRKDAEHPASFHPGLPKLCLEASASAGAVVIDPYMGIGTTGKVARSLGMSFIGIERSPKYFAVAQNSIERRFAGIQPVRGSTEYLCPRCGKRFKKLWTKSPLCSKCREVIRQRAKRLAEKYVKKAAQSVGQS